MRKLLFLISFIFSFLHFSYSQNPLVKQWDYRFGGTDEDWLYSFEQTKDKGYILGGSSESGINGDKTQSLWGGSTDFWIVKIDSLGIKQWDKDFGGTVTDVLFSLQQTADGGYIFGGISFSGISGNKTQPQWGSGDYWIVKTDSLGNIQWDKDFGGTEEDYLYSVQQTMDGGYILGGSSYSRISGDKTQDNWDTLCNPYCTPDYWIVKTDSLGNKQWDKRFGGTRTDELRTVEQTSDRGFILGGYSNSGKNGDKSQYSWGGFSDYWMVKTDSLGNKQWDKRFGGTSNEFFYSLCQTADNGYLLGGISYSDSSGDKTQNALGYCDYWIIKTDSLGIKQWDKQFGGTNCEDEMGSILQTLDGGYLLAGTSYSDSSGDKTENNIAAEETWIVKTDSLGNKQWDNTLQTVTPTWHDETGLAVQGKDGCYTFANYTHAGIGADKTQANWNLQQSTADYWIIKFCDSALTTSITQLPQLPQSPFTIYPNPADESLVISSQFGEKNKTELILIDVFGNELYHDVLRTPNYHLPTSTLSPGIYFLKAGNEVRKFVKE